MSAAAIARSLFITGTDTGVGKTRVATALIRQARRDGLRVAGFKPVASGAVLTPDGLRNDDAEQLLSAMDGSVDYASVNPCCYAPPIAPHLAARAVGHPIERAVLNAAHAHLARNHDLIVVEGAGGWQVPLDEKTTFADWVSEQGWPVVLVVALRLGCINHALLSVESIQRRAPLLAWVATQPPPAVQEAPLLLEDLQRRLPVAFWGMMPTGAHELAGAGFGDWCRQ